jgi:hypothetical protein
MFNTAKTRYAPVPPDDIAEDVEPYDGPVEERASSVLTPGAARRRYLRALRQGVVR